MAKGGGGGGMLPALPEISEFRDAVDEDTRHEGARSFPKVRTKEDLIEYGNALTVLVVRGDITVERAELLLKMQQTMYAMLVKSPDGGADGEAKAMTVTRPPLIPSYTAPPIEEVPDAIVLEVKPMRAPKRKGSKV
jgi:hypothetical protein